MSLHEHTDDELKAKLFSGELGEKKTVVSARVRAMDVGVDIAGVTGSSPVAPTIVFRSKQAIVYQKEWAFAVRGNIGGNILQIWAA